MDRRAFLTMLLLASCKKEMSLRFFHSQNKGIAGSASTPTHIEWLGDSIVKGAIYVTPTVGCYAALVSNYYSASFNNRGYDGAVGVPGWPYGRAENGGSFYVQAPYANTGNFGAGNYVYIAFGTNDFGNIGQTTGADATWKADYKAKIQQVIDYGYAPSQIILSTAPYQSIYPYVLSSISTIHDIAAELGTLYFDLSAYTYANGGDSLLYDGTHPDAAGHIVFANGIKAYIDSLL